MKSGPTSCFFKGLVSSSAFIYMYICTVLAIWALSPDSSVGG